MQDVVGNPKFLRKCFEKTKNNTINFENCTIFEKYDYRDNEKGTSLGLFYPNNYILNTIVPYLKANSNIKKYSEEDAEKYYGKPLALSMHEYGTIDYWWIILAVNGYFNAVEFTGWKQLIIPAKYEISNIIDKEMYVDDTIGKLPDSNDE